MVNIDFNANPNSRKPAPTTFKAVSKKLVDSILEIIYTEYVGQPDEKERRLRNTMESNGYTYSRQSIKDIFYSQYAARGGYRSKDEFTAWLFPE